MKLFNKKEKKTYKYAIEFKNGSIKKGEIKAFGYKDIYYALMRKYFIITDYSKKAFYFNRDEIITLEVWKED